MMMINDDEQSGCFIRFLIHEKVLVVVMVKTGLIENMMNGSTRVIVDDDGYFVANNWIKLYQLMMMMMMIDRCLYKYLVCMFVTG